MSGLLANCNVTEHLVLESKATHNPVVIYYSFIYRLNNPILFTKYMIKSHIVIKNDNPILS